MKWTKKKWEEAIDKGSIKESHEMVDFGLSLQAKHYFEAAEVLKANNINSSPYYIMLSLSIECYLKSIRTTTYWRGSRGIGVMHEKVMTYLSYLQHCPKNILKMQIISLSSTK